MKCYFNMPKYLFLILFIFASYGTFSQPKEKIKISEIITELLSEKDSSQAVIVKNKIIVNDIGYGHSIKSFFDKTKVDLDSNGYIISYRELQIVDSEFESIIIDSIAFRKEVHLENVSLPGDLGFANCTFDKFSVKKVTSKYKFQVFSLEDSSIDQFHLEDSELDILNIKKSKVGNLFVSNCKLNHAGLRNDKIQNLIIYKTEITQLEIDNSVINGNQKLLDRHLELEEGNIIFTIQIQYCLKIWDSSIKKLSIENCHIGQSPDNIASRIGWLESEILKIESTTFYSPLILRGVFSSFTLQANEYEEGISLIDLDLFDRKLKIQWNDIKDKMISYYTKDSIVNINDEFKVNDAYLQNTELVYHIYTSYKNNGNRIAANASYIWLQNFEGKKLKMLYYEEGGIDNFLRWKLNTLMRIYTNHGTSPTKAVSISIYIMLGFALFYFFYPSEWDTKSKKKLVSDFKLFIKKNEHGYFKPLLALVKGFMISLVNALTLSLNAFVTLGFGTIPTTGLARYVCIIQGFIGWFLLSIFTVALINQVLF